MYETAVNYFVTGATGFIGRNLVQRLLQREGTIYALVRAGSRGRLEELRTGLGRRRGAGRADLRRPLPARASASPRRTSLTLRGEVDHFFHLAAVYDMTAGAEAQEIANVEGTRHAVELAGAIEAGCFHQISSIAAAGLYRGEWREDMFEEAEKLDTHPYFRTKHESERVVREECRRPWRVYRPGVVVGDSRTRRDRQDRRALLRLQAAAAGAPGAAVLAADGRGRRGRDQHRPGRLRRRRDRPHRPQARPRRPGLPPHRPGAEDAPAR